MLCSVRPSPPAQIDCVVISVSEETQLNHTVVFFKVVDKRFKQAYVDAVFVCRKETQGSASL